jgi:hypothetical protein
LLGSEWGGFGWLDDNQLLIDHLKADYNFKTMTLFNPFTGEKQDLKEYPDLVHDPAITFLRYNASLTRVLYPAIGAKKPLNLVDLRTDKVLASIPTSDYEMGSGKISTWSPDGKQVIFVTNLQIGAPSKGNESDELFLLTQEGQLSQGTHLSITYHPYLDISFPVWSPDNRYLAFLLDTIYFQEHKNSRVAILDTTTGIVQEFCNPRRMIALSADIWSPDGRFIAAVFIDPVTQDTKIEIIDIHTGEAGEINAPFGNLVGWLR